MSYLPGLACLIFPNAIQLIPERLPLFLCQKWEKEISKHTECLAFHAKSLDEGMGPNGFLQPDFATAACQRDTWPVTVRRT